eukprot:Hpha_TRINITY_DN16556_c0_g2::TRINITY_DN16556_c0_g2_i1::g.135714::m.135714
MRRLHCPLEIEPRILQGTLVDEDVRKAVDNLQLTAGAQDAEGLPEEERDTPAEDLWAGDETTEWRHSHEERRREDFVDLLVAQRQSQRHECAWDAVGAQGDGLERLHLARPLRLIRDRHRRGASSGRRTVKGANVEDLHLRVPKQGTLCRVSFFLPLLQCLGVVLDPLADSRHVCDDHARRAHFVAHLRPLCEDLPQHLHVKCTTPERPEHQHRRRTLRKHRRGNARDELPEMPSRDEERHHHFDVRDWAVRQEDQGAVNEEHQPDDRRTKHVRAREAARVREQLVRNDEMEDEKIYRSGGDIPERYRKHEVQHGIRAPVIQLASAGCLPLQRTADYKQNQRQACEGRVEQEPQLVVLTVPVGCVVIDLLRRHDRRRRGSKSLHRGVEAS